MILFADAFFYIALINRRDVFHKAVATYAREFKGRIVTTHWVLMEVGDALAASSVRSRVFSSFNSIARHPNTRVIEASADQFSRGLDLYHARPDKAWSLTDCISFNIMRAEGLQEALTQDHHFAQAGFVPLFAE